MSSDDSEIRSLLTKNFAASTARDTASVAATFMPDGDGWKIAAWRAMTFDETLLNMLRN